MANLTITVDDDVLKRARVRAAENDTSVNAILREELERYVGGARERALAELLAMEPAVAGPSESYVWDRDDIYRERLGRYPQR